MRRFCDWNVEKRFHFLIFHFLGVCVTHPNSTNMTPEECQNSYVCELQDGSFLFDLEPKDCENLIGECSVRCPGVFFIFSLFFFCFSFFQFFFAWNLNKYLKIFYFPLKSHNFSLSLPSLLSLRPQLFFLFQDIRSVHSLWRHPLSVCPKRRCVGMGVLTVCPQRLSLSFFLPLSSKPISFLFFFSLFFLMSRISVGILLWLHGRWVYGKWECAKIFAVFCRFVATVS